MVFGTTILGSNPSAPARTMKKISLDFDLINKFKNIFFPFYKSKEVKKLFGILEQGEPKNKKLAMFVGGCVRNYILKNVIDDLDLATVFTPEEIKAKFKNTSFKVIETGVEHGSVTILLNNYKFELTTLRRDVSTDGRHAEVKFTDDWKEDSNRRDFTINAIYLDKNGKLFDPQLGEKDLQNNVVKFIGDPGKRIEEDYLRIIRFIRFSIQYDHNILESSTINAIKLNLIGIKKLSKERILKELLKILSLKNFTNIFKNQELKNIFLIIFPEFKNLDRIKKLSYFSEESLLRIDTNMILAILLLDDSDNFLYFCHKYKVPNLTKNKLELLSRFFQEVKEDKNFFKKNIKKNTYFLGKDFLKSLAILLFFENKSFKYKELNLIFKDIEVTSVPKFPFDGEFLKKRGFTEGKKIGLALKELEGDWVKNNFSLSEDNINTILEKVKN